MSRQGKLHTEFIARADKVEATFTEVALAVEFCSLYAWVAK